MALQAARALLTYAQLEVPFHGTSLPPLIPQAVHPSRVALLQLQNLALVLFQLIHTVGVKFCTAVHLVEHRFVKHSKTTTVSMKFDAAMSFHLSVDK